MRIRPHPSGHLAFSVDPVHERAAEPVHERAHVFIVVAAEVSALSTEGRSFESSRDHQGSSRVANSSVPWPQHITQSNGNMALLNEPQL